MERFAKKGVKVIRLSVGECEGCPLRKTCLKKEEQTSKSISFDARVSPGPWILQKLRAKSERGKAALKERGASVEFAFARLKQRLGFRRLTHWGLKSCRVEVGVHLLAMNLAILGAKLGLEGLEKLRNALSAILRGCERPSNRREATKPPSPPFDAVRTHPPAKPETQNPSPLEPNAVQRLPQGGPSLRGREPRAAFAIRWRLGRGDSPTAVSAAPVISLR